MRCEHEPNRISKTKFLLLAGGTLAGSALGMFGAAIDVAAVTGYSPDQHGWILGEVATIGGLLGGFGTLALARRLGLFQWNLPNS